MCSLVFQKSHIKKTFSRRDAALCRPLFAYLVLTVVCVFGRSVISFLGLPDNLFTILRFGTTALLVLLALLKIKKTALLCFVFLEAFFAISYIISIVNGHLIGEDISLYLITTLLVCIPVCCFTMSVTDFECFIYYIKKAANINSVILLIYMFTYSFHQSGSYDMSGAYQLLFCFTIQFYEALKTKKKFIKLLLLLFCFLEVFFIFARGSRGPLLCLIVYLLLFFLKYANRNWKTRIATLICVICAFVILINFKTILLFLNNTMNFFGLESRTLIQLMDNTVLEDSGRGDLINSAQMQICDNWLLGYGAGSDSVLVGGYVHSIFYELLFDFGVVFGFFVFLFITILTIRMAVHMNSPRRDLSIALIACGYVMLFVSGTYLQNVYLFIFVGLALNSRLDRTNKVRRVYDSTICKFSSPRACA